MSPQTRLPAANIKKIVRLSQHKMLLLCVDKTTSLLYFDEDLKKWQVKSFWTALIGERE